MANYRTLRVWQKSMELVMEIYKVTDGFPREEIFSLTNQLRRAAVSIPSNIAEGYGRQSDREFYHFLQIAKGSLFEVQTQLYIAAGRKYLGAEVGEQLEQQLEEIGRMISSMQKKLR